MHTCLLWVIVAAAAAAAGQVPADSQATMTCAADCIRTQYPDKTSEEQFAYFVLSLFPGQFAEPPLNAAASATKSCYYRPGQCTAGENGAPGPYLNKNSGGPQGEGGQGGGGQGGGHSHTVPAGCCCHISSAWDKSDCDWAVDTKTQNNTMWHIVQFPHRNMYQGGMIYTCRLLTPAQLNGVANLNCKKVLAQRTYLVSRHKVTNMWEMLQHGIQFQSFDYTSGCACRCGD